MAKAATTFTSGELDAVDGALDFASGIGQRLAFFKAERAGYFVFAAAQDGSCAKQDLAATWCSHGAPAMRRGFGRCYRRCDLANARASDFAQRLAICGIDVGLSAPALCCDKLATNKVSYQVHGLVTLG